MKYRYRAHLIDLDEGAEVHLVFWAGSGTQARQRLAALPNVHVFSCETFFGEGRPEWRRQRLPAPAAQEPAA